MKERMIEFFYNRTNFDNEQYCWGWKTQTHELGKTHGHLIKNECSPWHVDQPNKYERRKCNVLWSVASMYCQKKQ